MCSKDWAGLNYDNSVALLKDRYGQPDKLVSAHMQAFFDQG